jgi:hypothetical protein
MRVRIVKEKNKRSSILACLEGDVAKYIRGTSRLQTYDLHSRALKSSHCRDVAAQVCGQSSVV